MLEGERSEAAAAGDWDELKLMLHPYMHWTRADGITARAHVLQSNELLLRCCLRRGVRSRAEQQDHCVPLMRCQRTW
jgi:hypothetical protein